MTSTTPGAITMITPDPDADVARRRGLRRMRTLAVSLLGLAAAVYVATLEPEHVNHGLVVGTSGVLLVDAGSSPAQGAALRASVEAAKKRREASAQAKTG